MKPTALTVWVFAAVMWCVTPPARADDQPAGPTLSPPTVSREFGRLRSALNSRLNTVLEAMSGNEDRFEELRFTEGFIERSPSEEALDKLRHAARVSGGFESLETRQLEPDLIGAWIRAKNDRRSLWILRLAVEATPPHRIDRLELDPAPIPGPSVEESWREFDESLAKARFRTSMAAYERRADGTLHALHAIEQDERRAIGLLGVLWAHLALAELVNEGGAAWDRALAFEDSLRSLPASRTSLLEPGAELTLHEFARRATRENDNTAAEHLIAMLGRERIELARDGIRSRAAEASGAALAPGGEPFLTTLEFYRLKCGATNLIKRYAEAPTVEQQRRLLEAEVASAVVDPTLYQAWTSPQKPDRVGWTASPRELCLLGARLVELSRSPDQSWAIDSLRPAANESTSETLYSSAQCFSGEPGVMAGLWIFDRADGRSIILAVIMNRDRRAIPKRDASEVVARAAEILSRVP